MHFLSIDFLLFSEVICCHLLSSHDKSVSDVFRQLGQFKEDISDSHLRVVTVTRSCFLSHSPGRSERCGRGGRPWCLSTRLGLNPRKTLSYFTLLPVMHFSSVIKIHRSQLNRNRKLIIHPLPLGRPGLCGASLTAWRKDVSGGSGTNPSLSR